MKRVISLEYLFAAMLTALFFAVVSEFDWWWLIVLFLLFDVSMVGYTINNKIGAYTYNVGHSLIGPAILAAAYIATSNQAVLFIVLLWLFHIFIDRSLGYGLKHASSFHHTHLGKIGKEVNK